MIYIGMHETDNLEDSYLGSGKRLKRAIKYYGKQFFKRRILHVFETRLEASEKERELVNEKFVERDDTYNIMLGGDGFNHTKERLRELASNMNEKKEQNPTYIAKRKLAAGNTFKKLHKEGKVKFDNFKGKKHSEETKKKIGKKNSIKQSGSKNSQYGSRWITNKIENKKIGKDEPIPEGWFLGRKIK
jgi:hypothetical protein